MNKNLQVVFLKESIYLSYLNFKKYLLPLNHHHFLIQRIFEAIKPA